MTVAQLTRRSHGPEFLAKHAGKCGICRKEIRRGDPAVVVERMGETHAACGKGYCRVLAEHLPDESNDL